MASPTALGPEQREAAICAYRIPLSRPLVLPSVTLRERRGLVLRLRQHDQTTGEWREGLGEAAPLAGFSPESLQQCQKALTAAASAWAAGESLALARRIAAPSPSAAFAVDIAGYELDSGPLCGPADEPEMDSYPLLDGEPEVLLARWQAWPRPYPAVVKLKVGRRSCAAETTLIAGLLTLSPGLKLRLDANRGWTLLEAQRWLATLGRAACEQIEWLEEPCITLNDSLALAGKTDVPLALDESLREGLTRLPESPQLVALILKPAISGGLDWLMHWLQQAEQSRCRAVLSSSYATSLGSGQLAALAARLTPSEPAGLDTLGSFTQGLLRSDPEDGKPLLGWSALKCCWRSE